MRDEARASGFWTKCVRSAKQALMVASARRGGGAVTTAPRHSRTTAGRPTSGVPAHKHRLGGAQILSAASPIGIDFTSSNWLVQFDNTKSIAICVDLLKGSI